VEGEAKEVEAGGGDQEEGVRSGIKRRRGWVREVKDGKAER